MTTTKRRSYLIFAIVTLALLMSTIDSTIVAVALPTLLVDLKTKLALVGWTITGYQFSQSIIMPIAGKLSDDWGRKRLFLIALIVFTVSSIAAALAPNIYWLILFRIVQGLGGGAFLPSATGIVADAFGQGRAKAIGLFGSIVPIGSIIGPNLGGFIVDSFSWHWIFIVNVPIGIALVILSIAILPNQVTVSKSSTRSIDFTGIGLFVGGLLAILYGATDLANNPVKTNFVPWILFAVGVVFIVLFMRHENKVTAPMIDTRLIMWRPFFAANVYNFIYGALVMGVFVYTPYYATVAYGMTAGENGLLLTPRSVAIILASTISALTISRFRYRKPMLLGLGITAICLFFLSRGYHNISILNIHISDLFLLALLMGFTGIGGGISNPAATNAALDLMPEKTAAVTGMRGTSRVVGGMFGTAAVALILSLFQDKAKAMQDIYLGFTILLLATIPIIYLIPDAPNNKRLQPKNVSH